MSDLQRSEAARFAASVFFEDFNDVDVYVEDTAEGFSKIYSILLGRLLADRLTISRVFPLGGRSSVIAAAKRDDIPNRKSVFIVDGDLNLLCGEREDLPPNVIKLERYCIENYICDDNAIIDILDDEHASMRHQQIKDMLLLEDWREKNAPAFKKLFLTYAVAHLKASGIATVSRKYSNFVKGATGDIDMEKVNGVCEEIAAAVDQQFGASTFQATYQNLELGCDSNLCFISHYVSAKDYTLPILFARMRALIEFRANNIALKIRMAKSCSLESMNGTRREILARLFPPDIDRQVAA